MYIIFLILATKHIDCGYLVDKPNLKPPQRVLGLGPVKKSHISDCFSIHLVEKIPMVQSIRVTFSVDASSVSDADF